MLQILLLFTTPSLADMFSESGSATNLPGKSSSAQPPPQPATIVPIVSLDNPFPTTKSDSVRVFIGKCPALESFLPKLDEYMSKNPDLKLTLLMMVGDGRVVPEGLRGREIHYAGAKEVEELGISQVPTTVITKSGVVYKLVGDLDIVNYKKMKVSEKTPQFIVLGDEGPSCPARPMPSRSDAEMRALDPQNMKIDLPAFSIPSVELPRSSEKKQFKVDVPVLAFVPFIKLAVFSQVDMPWAKDLITKGYQGCCTDCSTFATGISACNEELLANLRVNSVPARIDIDFKTGKALVREGK
jgi:hypothetical protein